MAYMSASNLKRWQNRSILVTGASVGIGAATCANLVRSGMNVFGCARSVDKIEALSQSLSAEGVSGRLIAMKCDLSNEEEILEMFQKIAAQGGVDVLVNNAGMGLLGTLLTGKTGDWDTMWNLNVRAVCICTREFVSGLKQRGVSTAHVIHISSMSAHRVPPAADLQKNVHFYGATKHALRAIAEGQRREASLFCKGLRVTCVSPGLVETEFIKTASNNAPGATEVYSTSPVMQAADIADTVAYALSAPDTVDINDILIRPTNGIA